MYFYLGTKLAYKVNGHVVRVSKRLDQLVANGSGISQERPSWSKRRSKETQNN